MSLVGTSLKVASELNIYLDEVVTMAETKQTQSDTNRFPDE